MGLTLYLYNALLWVGLVVLSPFWTLYLAVVPKTRAGFRQKLGLLTPDVERVLIRRPDATGRRRLWFHAVSVGEFNAIRPLILDLRDTFDIVISTTTRTGHNLALRTFPDCPVIYFSYDLRPIWKRMMRLVQPDLLIITETELWPNMMDVVTRRFHCPLIVINGRLSQRSWGRYQWIRALMKPVMQGVTHWYMQSQADAERVRQLGDLPPERVTMTGNLKFDLIPTVEPERRAFLSHVLRLSPGDTVLTFASTHSGEDALLLDVWLTLKKDFPELKCILAPRHPERAGEMRGCLMLGRCHTPCAASFPRSTSIPNPWSFWIPLANC